MADFDPERFQQSFGRISSHRDRLRFEGRHELVEDLAIILEVVYASFRQFQAFNQRLSLLPEILGRINDMAGELDTLKAQVASSISVQESAIQLLQGLKAALDAAIAANNSGDPTALLQLSENLGSEGAKLAAAITANTPAAPAPIPVPVPGPDTGPAPGGTGGGLPGTQTALQVAQARNDTTVSQNDTTITLQNASNGTQTTYDKATGAVVSNGSNPANPVLDPNNPSNPSNPSNPNNPNNPNPNNPNLAGSFSGSNPNNSNQPLVSGNSGTPLANARDDAVVSETPTTITKRNANGTTTTYDKSTGAVVSTP